jgi:hypothetical protein
MDQNQPIAGYATLTQLRDIEASARTALTAFNDRSARINPRSPRNGVLTGRYHTAGRFGSRVGEVKTYVEIELTVTVESDGVLPESSWCEQFWIDLADGTFAGDSLREVLDIA